MVRIDPQNALPRVPHYNIKSYVADPLCDAIDWLPTSEREVAVAMLRTSEPGKALKSCRLLTRMMAYDRFNLTTSSTSDVLLGVQEYLRNEESHEVVSFAIGLIVPDEHRMDLLTGGESCMRWLADSQPVASGETISNGEDGIRRLQFQPGGGVGIFPHAPSENDLVLKHSQDSFLNVRMPGPQLTGLVIERKKQQDLERQLQQLTARERQTLELIMKGRTVKEIAGELNITIQTASKHRGNVWDKLGVSNDVQIVLRMLTSPE